MQKIILILIPSPHYFSKKQSTPNLTLLSPCSLLNKYAYFLTLILSLTLTTQSTWQTIATGTNQVPAHLYSITISNPSDFINGVCYWTGNADLDIYIYREGYNYMTRSVYAARFISSSYDSRQAFSYRPSSTGNYIIRVDHWYLPGPFQYYLNVSTTSNPTVVQYTNKVSSLKYFMAVQTITNMPQSSLFLPVMFTYSPTSPTPPSTTLPQIDLQLALNTNLKLSLIANQISCLDNLQDLASINQTWSLIFNHSIPTTITQINFYQYELSYSNDSDFCVTYCRSGFAWDNSTSQCVAQNNNNNNGNTDNNGQSNQISDQKSSGGYIYIFIGIGASIAFFMLVALIFVLIRVCSKRTAAAVQPEQIHPQRQVQSMSEINMLEKNICAICLGESCTAILPCTHTFHHKCITEWSKKKSQCPNCRRNFLTWQIKVRKEIQNEA